MIVVISIALALRSLKRMNKSLHEVEEAKLNLRQGKVVFHENHSPLSSDSSKDR